LTAKKKYTEDLQFVAAYLGGDATVEKSLYKMLRKLIDGLITQLSRRGSVFQDRENVISQIICEIMVKDDKKVLRGYKGKSKLSTYLFPVVRNKIVDAVRKERRYHDRVVSGDIPEDIPDFENRPESDIEMIVEEHIRNESAENQFIKYSKWMRELSYLEIVRKLKKKFGERKSINIKQIGYILTLNRKRLQKKLVKQGALKRHISGRPD